MENIGNARNIEEFLHQAMSEDLGRGDLFAKIATNKSARAKIIAKSDGVFSGEVYAKKLCEMYGVKITLKVTDSARFETGTILAELHGGYIELLQIERVLLNIIAHSSGIATYTKTFVDKLDACLALRDSKNIKAPKILDTRKTRTLLRELEKYSVRNGGASNHRFGLDDALMLKDTHLALIDDINSFIKRAREILTWTHKIEIEVSTLKQAKNAMEAGADIIMCDNMDIDGIKEVIALRNSKFPQVLLEASGNINLDNICNYIIGLDAISIGALIHQATWLDISMKMMK